MTAINHTAGMDIVSRLRTSVGFTLADEAADEIEALRDVVGRIASAPSSWLDADSPARRIALAALGNGRSDLRRRATPEDVARHRRMAEEERHARGDSSSEVAP